MSIEPAKYCTVCHKPQEFMFSSIKKLDQTIYLCSRICFLKHAQTLTTEQIVKSHAVIFVPPAKK